jgi:hypothetical protein
MVMVFEQSHLDGKRGQRGNQARPAQVLLDGRYVTYAQLGDELGVAPKEARRRYVNAKARGVWPVTLEVLR